MKSAPNDMEDYRMYEFWWHCIGQTVMLSHPITYWIDFHQPVRGTLDWTEPTKQTFGFPKPHTSPTKHAILYLSSQFQPCIAMKFSHDSNANASNSEAEQSQKDATPVQSPAVPQMHAEEKQCWCRYLIPF